MKNTTIKHYHVHGINKTMVASEGRYELFQPNKLINFIEGKLFKIVRNTYMKCDGIPRLLIIFFS